MNYIEETSTPGETIIGQASFSWLFMALELTPFWLMLVALAVGFEALLRTAVAHYVPPWAVNFVVPLLVVVGLWRYLITALPWVYTQIAVTNRRFVYRHGFLTRKVEEVAINRIQGVNMSQSLVGRMFDFGSVVVFGVGLDEVKLPPIAHPMVFRRAIQEAINESMSPDVSFNHPNLKQTGN